ncbi:MAG: outer membrane beta-barrel protein [Planctomycetaceae bacterium]|nr:outer membrane beta-barrel protein [Planctomycetaceae bacterium]
MNILFENIHNSEKVSNSQLESASDKGISDVYDSVQSVQSFQNTQPFVLPPQIQSSNTSNSFKVPSSFPYSVPLLPIGSETPALLATETKLPPASTSPTNTANVTNHVNSINSTNSEALPFVATNSETVTIAPFVPSQPVSNQQVTIHSVPNQQVQNPTPSFQAAPFRTVPIQAQIPTPVQSPPPDNPVNWDGPVTEIVYIPSADVSDSWNSSDVTEFSAESFESLSKPVDQKNIIASDNWVKHRPVVTNNPQTMKPPMRQTMATATPFESAEKNTALFTDSVPINSPKQLYSQKLPLPEEKDTPVKLDDYRQTSTHTDVTFIPASPLKNEEQPVMSFVTQKNVKAEKNNAKEIVLVTANLPVESKQTTVKQATIKSETKKSFADTKPMVSETVSKTVSETVPTTVPETKTIDTVLPFAAVENSPAAPTTEISEQQTASIISEQQIAPKIRKTMECFNKAALIPQPNNLFSVTNQPVTNQQETLQNSYTLNNNPYTINNTHSCDDLTCGEDGCSSYSLRGIFRHLNEQTIKYGLCNDCGFSRCNNKTLGSWYYDGWLAGGAFMNTHYPENRNNFPLYYNDRNAEAVVNQLYLTFGRRINPRAARWDFGGRIDLLYGTDYFFTSSLGLETRRYNYIFPDLPTLEPLEAALHWNSNSGVRRLGTVPLYGLSLPQTYAELFIPIGNGVTVKAGHFYSGMGLESAMSPENFFYSHSYSFMYGSPTTLTGIIATAKISSRFSVLLGLSRGWNAFDKPNNNLSGLGGLEWKSFDKRNAFSFLIHSGEESFRNGDNRTHYAMTWQHQLTPRWHYALEHTFGNEKNGAALNLLDETRGTAQWYSLAQYLQWKWSEKFTFGLRGEWFRDDGQSRIQKDFIDSILFRLEGKDYFQITLGANWKPTRYITIRPEIRYDWSNVVITDAATGNQNGIYSNNKKQMLSVAIDGIFRF